MMQKDQNCFLSSQMHSNHSIKFLPADYLIRPIINHKIANKLLEKRSEFFSLIGAESAFQLKERQKDIKLQLLSWYNFLFRLMSISLERRRNLFTITSPSLIRTINSMLQYSFQNTSFAYEVSILDSFDMEERITIEKQNDVQGINFQIDKSRLIQEIENEFLSSVRVGDIIHFGDTLFLSQSLVDNIDKLLKYFNKLTDNLAFCHPCW